MSYQERRRQRVSLTSDGTASGTKVLLDGEPLPGVQEIQYSIGLRSRAVLTLKIKDVPFAFMGDMQEIDLTGELRPAPRPPVEVT